MSKVQSLSKDIMVGFSQLSKSSRSKRTFYAFPRQKEGGEVMVAKAQAYVGLTWGNLTAGTIVCYAKRTSTCLQNITLQNLSPLSDHFILLFKRLPRLPIIRNMKPNFIGVTCKILHDLVPTSLFELPSQCSFPHSHSSSYPSHCFLNQQSIFLLYGLCTWCLVFLKCTPSGFWFNYLRLQQESSDANRNHQPIPPLS